MAPPPSKPLIGGPFKGAVQPLWVLQPLWVYLQVVGIILPLKVPTTSHPVLNPGPSHGIGHSCPGMLETGFCLSLHQLSFLPPATSL